MRQITAREFMMTALHSEYGHFIVFNTYDRALRFRNACYGVKARDKYNNNKIFAGDASYLPSVKWDALQFDLSPVGEGWELRATKLDLNPDNVMHGPLTKEQVEKRTVEKPIVRVVENPKQLD